MRRTILAGLVALAPLAALSACKTDAADPPAVSTTTQTQTQTLSLTQAAHPTDEASCLAAGGRWTRGGLSLMKLCILPTPDGGKACRRATDCTGTCLADTRSCSKETPLFGCYAFLDDDGTEVTICVD